jgi:predicted nucleotidyltransferase
MDENNAAIDALGKAVGQEWANLKSARQLAIETLHLLRVLFKESDSEDTSIVVLGSLGRLEFTEGSDIDWNLLVDGIANPNHHTLFLDARQKIQETAAKQVGAEGTFGTFISSHDLIHKIGGEDDTNSNTTRRLLLLSESTAVGEPVAHRRVVKNVLKRYLLEDRSFWRGTSVHRHHVPHFLLNDFARFWRTIAVDFAYKLRDRSGRGWAIRNIKPRFSRKLLYVAGLLGCYRCHLDFGPELRDHSYPDDNWRLGIVDQVFSIFDRTPIEILAEFLLARPALHDLARRILNEYDAFLGLLRDPETRAHLEETFREFRRRGSGLPSRKGKQSAVPRSDS